MLTLAAIPVWLIGLLVALFVVLSVMMMLVVLIQRPQGGGLSEAFGAGGGSGATAFGAKTGDALTTATIGIFVLFIGFAVGLNYVVKPPAATPNEPVVGAPGAPGADGKPAVGATATDEQGNAVPVTLEKVDPSKLPAGLQQPPPAKPAGSGAAPTSAAPPAATAPATAPAATPPPSNPPAGSPPAEQPKPQ